MGLRRYFMQYATLLSKWQLHRQRAALHALLMLRIPHAQQLPRVRSPVLLCHFCHGPLTGSMSVPPEQAITHQRCPNVNCAKAAPSCAVCLMPIFIVRSPSGGGGEASSKNPVAPALEVDSWVAWCQSCRHGGHVAHLEEWFSKHVKCPVAGCHCQCGLF